MNILVAMPLGEFGGGAERMLHTYFTARDRKGPLQLKFLFFSNGKLADSARDAGYMVHIIEVGRLRQVYRIAGVQTKIAALLGDLAVDAILIWMPKAAMYVSVPARKKGIPVFIWRHDIPSHINRLDRLAMSYCPPLSVACSSETARTALTYAAPQIRQCTAIYPGVLPLGYDIDAVADTRYRVVVDRDPDALVIGTIARLQPWKRIDLFLEAVALVKESVPHVRALVVGGESHGLSAGYGKQLQKLGDRLLGKDIVFAGEQSDVGNWLQVMDVFVLASKREPFGIALVEAMAAGKPVIAFAGGGPKEIINSSTVGTVLSSNATVDDLATAIYAFLSPVERQLAAKANPIRAKDFSPKRMADAIDKWILAGVEQQQEIMVDNAY